MPWGFHIWHHHEPSPLITRELDEIKQLLKTIQREIKTMNEELTKFAADLDAATNAIASRIDKLLADQKLSPEVRDKLNAELARLQALGADPANPVPAETPTT